MAEKEGNEKTPVVWDWPQLINAILNPPDGKMGQLTDLPDDSILAFAGMTAINKLGKVKEVDLIEEFQTAIFAYRRSRKGQLLAAMINLTREKAAGEMAQGVEPVDFTKG